MKKLITLVSAFVLCLALAGCGGQAGLADGTYTTTVDTDSSMFRVEACQLVVKDGQMTATISLPGEGFSRLYLGTAEDAAKAPDDAIYDYYKSDAGLYTFDVPVAALEEEMPVAAFGHRRDTWYDHTVTFHEPAADTQTTQSTAAEPEESGSATPHPGEYRVAVTLEGGTGRATIESPAKLVVADGKMTATIVWSSPNYDQMVVDGTQYLPVNASGNSTFEIPVAALDEDLSVQAETTAMSEPHMIDYTLRFDSGSLK